MIVRAFFFPSFINFFPLWATNFFTSFYIYIGKGVHQSCILSPCQVPWSMGKNTGVVCYFLLQKIFLTQGSNPGLLHCRQILYQLSYQGSSKKYWSGLPCPPPGDLLNPGIEPRSPTLQADSLPSEPPGKPRSWVKSSQLEVLPLHLGYNPFPVKLVSGEDCQPCGGAFIELALQNVRK